MKLAEIQQRKEHCFDHSWQLMMELTKGEPDEVMDKYKLVHALVTNAEGRTFPHAWLEQGGKAIDSAKSKEDPIILDASKFRKFLNATNIIEYTPIEGMIQAARNGHYGPWDESLT